MRKAFALAGLTVLLARPTALRAADEQRLGQASIQHDTQRGTWTLTAGGAALTIASGSGRDFQLLSLTSPSGQSWLADVVPAASLTVGGASRAIGYAAAGFEFETEQSSSDGYTLQLDIVFLAPSMGLRATRHFVVSDGSAAFETWTSIQALAAPVQVGNLNAFELRIPNGTMHWLNGLQGDSADNAHDTAFTLQQQALDVGSSLTLGAQGRSSEQTVPWFAVDGARDEFFAGLMWSGAWTLTASRTASGLGLSLGLAPMATTVTTVPIDGPHAIFGVAAGGLPEASASLRSYVLNGVRKGQPLTPRVTYNTWFAYGTSIDEPSLRAEMDGAAALGTELFVVDAGWYIGAGAANSFDYTSGLGSWEVDPARFPDGLRPLTEHAHALGMQFGLWVEPERVALANVGASSGVDESWLATNGGSYGSTDSAQICLAGAAARQWILGRLVALIDAAQPDYVKWDNNFWINCDRAGHGHGASDGNFAHVNGLYELLDTLRQLYPGLQIENVSGGGNRLDFAMMRYADVAWMDDRTAPSVHVRHNLQGLAVAFPPAYLLSFVTDHATEPLTDGPDVPLYMRSRMAGALGLCFLTAQLSVDDAAEIAREVALYKSVRDTLAVSSAALLSQQATVAANGPEWDILQATAPDGVAAVVYAYQSDEAASSVAVKPTDLQPASVYSVESVDAGPLGTATGSSLMTDGIEVVTSPVTAAHILKLVATP